MLEGIDIRLDLFMIGEGNTFGEKKKKKKKFLIY
jgi:hypothetical protein